ncbi:YbhB/YbcL family Raf kinase inhibitor-like protein [Agrobacterium pusense]|uniref:YbhB/YbcL family Raf kinase inhibitor-like protein n=1 Tax=Agrobacterium pusense TaxID=648995 RepID=UPI003D0F1AF5
MRILLGAALSLALSGTAFAGMKASFEWGPTGKCFDSKSPPFKVSSVPAGTTKLSFLMKDLDAPDFYHGGSKVDYSGQADIPYGSFRYKGPCPPNKHRYMFTVRALDANGKELGIATAAKLFPQ